MKNPREIPYDFIFDYLLPIEITVKPYFGIFGIYSGERFLLVLRRRSKEVYKNGIWVAVARGRQASLIKELPALQPIFKPSKTEDDWLMDPESADDFEATGIRLCELIVRGDPRIGKVPKGEKSKK
jgi:hypothetical protein